MNIFSRPRNQVVFQNNHFADNAKQNKTNEGHKIGIIDHLNESFQAGCIDEYMIKFKGIPVSYIMSLSFTTMTLMV